jgi:hypothetical protein
MADNDICAILGVEGRLGEGLVLNAGSSVTWEISSPSELVFSVNAGGKAQADIDIDIDEVREKLEDNPEARKFASGAAYLGYFVRVGLPNFDIVKNRACVTFTLAGGNTLLSFGQKAVFVEGEEDRLYSYTSINFNIPNIIPSLPFGVKATGSLSAAIKTTILL